MSNMKLCDTEVQHLFLSCVSLSRQAFNRRIDNVVHSVTQITQEEARKTRGGTEGDCNIVDNMQRLRVRLTHCRCRRFNNSRVDSRNSR